MSNNRYIFTSESVTEGHPDKIADQISDAVLDAVLEKDPEGRVACETFVTTGFALIGGEITTNCYVDIQDVVRNTVKSIGYTRPELGFDYRTTAVLTTINHQSPDIAQGVNQIQHREQGAGDQGMMFGFACNETPELMPQPIMLAHQLARRLSTVRKEGILPYLRPDGKSQVSIEYADGKPVALRNVIISCHHSDVVSIDDLRHDIENIVIKPTLPSHLSQKNMKIFINPTGRFVVGGPVADTGLTGRKIIVDTYGGKGSHGGGCFSGKDPSKVDRSASYMARYIAKNIVAAKIAAACEVQVAYAIGIPEPVSVMVDTFGTSSIPDDRIAKAVRKVFVLRPGEIIQYLNLKRPIYQKTAAYGHFGRHESSFTWEKVDKTEALLNELQ